MVIDCTGSTSFMDDYFGLVDDFANVIGIRDLLMGYIPADWSVDIDAGPYTSIECRYHRPIRRYNIRDKPVCKLGTGPGEDPVITDNYYLQKARGLTYCGLSFSVHGGKKYDSKNKEFSKHRPHTLRESGASHDRG